MPLPHGATTPDSPSVLTIGVVSADHYIRVRSLPRRDEKVNGSRMGWFAGGMCANFAVAARQMGARTRFLTVLGDDSASQEMQASLEQLEVDTTGSTVVPGATCWSSISLIDDAAEKMLVILESGLPLPDVEISAAEASSGSWDVVYPVALETKWCTKIGSAAQRAGSLVVYDLEPYFVEAAWGTDDFAAMIRTADLLFLKLDSARVAGFQEAAEAARALRGLGAKTIVVTNGPGEVYFTDASQSLVASPPRVDVIDSTGAGDAFAGTFCALYAQRMAAEECLRTAVAVGALSVTGLGCQAYAPIDREQLSALRTQVGVRPA